MTPFYCDKRTLRLTEGLVGRTSALVATPPTLTFSAIPLLHGLLADHPMPFGWERHFMLAVPGFYLIVFTAAFVRLLFKRRAGRCDM